MLDRSQRQAAGDTRTSAPRRCRKQATTDRRARRARRRHAAAPPAAEPGRVRHRADAAARRGAGRSRRASPIETPSRLGLDQPQGRRGSTTSASTTTARRSIRRARPSCSSRRSAARTATSPSSAGSAPPTASRLPGPDTRVDGAGQARRSPPATPVTLTYDNGAGPRLHAAPSRSTTNYMFTVTGRV